MPTQAITVQVAVAVAVPPEKAWNIFTEPLHVCQWNQASADWHTPHGENDLRPGGRFCYRMESRDGSEGFDFWGINEEVHPGSRLVWALGDGRRVEITFERSPGGTLVTEVFDPETENPVELQRAGWQAILDSFKTWAERA